MLLAAIVTSSFVLSRQAAAKENGNGVENATALRAHRQGKEIVLAGSEATAVQVEWSDDGAFFEVTDTVKNTGAHRYRDDLASGSICYRICCTGANGNELLKPAVEVLTMVQRK